eukprot:gi/632990146/ref/XP_007884027.1/ PREDICTED: sorting nexin-15-like [Callorhinchus milii]
MGPQVGLPLPLPRSEPEPQSHSPERECELQPELGPTTDKAAPATHLPDELGAGLRRGAWGSPNDSGTEEEEDEARLQTRSPLSDNELAQFDPCAKGGQSVGASRQSEAVRGSEEGGDGTEDMEDRLRRLRMCAEAPGDVGLGETEDEGIYLSTAAEQIKEALEREARQDYAVAFKCYRNGVDTLLKGVQGDTNTERREAVKKKTADYMKHAEAIFDLHLRDSPHDDFSHS